VTTSTKPVHKMSLERTVHMNPLYGTLYTLWYIRMGDQYNRIELNIANEAMYVYDYLKSHEKPIAGSLSNVRTLLQKITT